MSKPRKKLNVPDLTGQSQIMFYSEGNPIALVVTNVGERSSERVVRVRSALIGLTWCQARRAAFVYVPASLEGN